MGLNSSMSGNITKYQRKDAEEAKSARAKKKGKSPEAKLQDEMSRFFLDKGFMVIRHNSGVMKSEESLSYFRAYIIANTGGSGGLSDLTIGKDGKLIYVEVKAGYNKQTEPQKRFEDLCNKFNMPYSTAYSVEEADKFARQHFNYN